MTTAAATIVRAILTARERILILQRGLHLFRACATAFDLRTEALYAGLVPSDCFQKCVHAAESASSRKNEEGSFASLRMTTDDQKGDSQSGQRDRSPNASQFEVVNLRPRVGMAY